jgi:hypothetical protein
MNIRVRSVKTRHNQRDSWSIRFKTFKYSSYMQISS